MFNAEKCKIKQSVKPYLCPAILCAPPTNTESLQWCRNPGSGAQQPNSPVESSPFAELVHALATAQQSQHQALLTLRKEQEQWFEALVLAQQEDREAFRHLLASAGSTSTPTAGPSPLTVTKMGPQDHPEVFITLFEQVTEASGWPMEQRAARLLPLLTGEAQLATLQLPADRRLAYADLRRAVLQHVGRTPEQQRQHFRALRLEEVGRPFAFGQQLLDTCWRWLRADNCDGEEIVDQVVLEQFVSCLPAGTAEWVQCHRPASLDQAVELVEDHLAAVPAAGQQMASSLLSSSLSLSPPPPVSRPCPIPPPRRWGPAPPQPARRTRGALPFLPSVSVSPPPQVSEPQITGAEGKPGPVCWRCGEPGHLQQQCTAMEKNSPVTENRLHSEPIEDLHKTNPTLNSEKVDF
ncbi:zinc finger and SCAN domain-containing protein 29-like [Neoarius graeffei]|uniref:zinc finger and SCAN domain-containing protein 29-like n=1 Tax=Neoarius graeffei TaxID=443677 RepID=UPI00298D1534|nr:zinc finger and SCAN domain-containing protein 29-like [Neoarius graeffei]